MTLNAPKGARREAPRPLGAFLVTKTALKCQKNVLKMPGDIFLTFFGHFAEAQLDPRTFF